MVGGSIWIDNHAVIPDNCYYLLLCILDYSWDAVIYTEMAYIKPRYVGPRYGSKNEIFFAPNGTAEAAFTTDTDTATTC